MLNETFSVIFKHYSKSLIFVQKFNFDKTLLLIFCFTKITLEITLFTSDIYITKKIQFQGLKSVDEGVKTGWMSRS